MANFNFNKVIMGGRLTADPELKTTTSGISVVSFGIAVNRPTRANEEPKTDFHNCEAWRGTAEFIERYFKKGSSICVVGKLQNDHFQKDGKVVTREKIVVDEATFVDGKNDDKPKVVQPQFEDITDSGEFDPGTPLAVLQDDDDSDLPF